jgi:putative transposase
MTGYRQVMVDNRYRVNAGSVFSLKYHLVWCPKYRKRILVNALEKRLRELLYQKAKEIKTEIHALEIMPDHVHMFVESDPTMAPARLAAQFKGFTSHQLREEFSWLKSYLPSCGRGATTSAASVPSAKRQSSDTSRIKGPNSDNHILRRMW